jgi:hypothetical protein
MQHQVNANLLHKWIRQSKSMNPILKSSSNPQTDSVFLLCCIRLQSNHAEEFLKGWQGQLVCDDYSGFTSGQMVEVGCMAHARRKLRELHVTGEKSDR